MALFLAGFGLGLAVVATPGAVTAQAIRNGLERGFRAALSVQVGALVGLVLWGGIGLLGAALFTGNQLANLILSTMGVLLLLWLAWRALRAAFRGQQQETAPENIRGDFTVGALLSLASPLPVAFWLGVGSNVVRSPAPIEVVFFLVGLVSSGLLWSVLLAGLTAWGQRYITPLLFRVVNFICGLALGVFAARLAYNAAAIML